MSWTKSTDGACRESCKNQQRWNHMLQLNQMPGSAYPFLAIQQVRLHMHMVLLSRSFCCCEGREESERWQWWSESNNEGRRTKKNSNCFFDFHSVCANVSACLQKDPTEKAFGRWSDATNFNPDWAFPSSISLGGTLVKQNWPIWTHPSGNHLAFRSNNLLSMHPKAGSKPQ